MNREQAIEAGARAFYEWTVGDSHADFNDLVGTSQDYWRAAAGNVIDAATPHLTGEPVGWAAIFQEEEPTFEGVIYINRDDFDRDYPGDTPGVQRCALVPVEDQP